MTDSSNKRSFSSSNHDPVVVPIRLWLGELLGEGSPPKNCHALASSEDSYTGVEDDMSSKEDAGIEGFDEEEEE